jgi:hypothetical protein
VTDHARIAEPAKEGLLALAVGAGLQVLSSTEVLGRLALERMPGSLPVTWSARR